MTVARRTLPLLQYIPPSQKDEWPQEQHLGRLLAQLLFSSQGYALVKSLPIEDHNITFTSLAEGLGRLITEGAVIPGHPLEGGAVYRIEPKCGGHGIKDERDLLIFSTTEGDFPCHTDGYSSRTPADIVLMLCVRADRQGGVTVLAHVDDLLRGLSAEEVALLREPVFPSGSERGPILFERCAEQMIRFNLREITRSGGFEEGALPSEHQRALRKVERLASFSRARHSFRLTPGDCLVLDNRKVLHGRTQLSPGSRRLIKRLWVRLPEA